MASLLYPDEDQSQWPTSLLPVDDGTPPVLQADPRAAALATVYQQVRDEMARQQRISADRGLWDDQTGLPTGKGLLDAIQQTGMAVALGTGAPGDAPAPRLNLERVNPRNLKPMSGDPDLAVPGNHAWFVRNPAGDHVGTVDTEWDPMMGELHIADLQSNEGANSLGPGAVKQLRDALLEQYPEAKTLSGYRITGSDPNREIFQRVRQDQGRKEQ